MYDFEKHDGRVQLAEKFVMKMHVLMYAVNAVRVVYHFCGS